MLLDQGRTTLDVTLGNTSGLQLLSTVTEGQSLSTGFEGATRLKLIVVVFAWMGHGQSSQCQSN